MHTTATRNAYATTLERVLFLAFALREKTWQFGCTIGHGHKPCERTMAARALTPLLDEAAHATGRFGLCATAPVVSGDEAGCEGCWQHRFLQAYGLSTSVVDASASAVTRCQRRAKSDGLDMRKVLVC